MLNDVPMHGIFIAPSEISSEENLVRVNDPYSHRRWLTELSTCHPWASPPPRYRRHTVTLGHEDQGSRSITLYDYRDQISDRRISAPLLGSGDGNLDNSAGLRQAIDELKNSNANILKSFPFPSLVNTSPSDTRGTGSYTHTGSNINKLVDGGSLVMLGAHSPSPHPNSHPYHNSTCHHPGAVPAAFSTHFQRDNSASSLNSEPARGSSIRIVKPNLTLSPPQKPKGKEDKDETAESLTTSQVEKNRLATMYANKQDSQHGQDDAQDYGPRPKVVRQPTRSHGRTESQQQSINILDGYGHGRDYETGSSISKPGPTAQNANMGAESTGRGRTMRRRYEFIDESPVKETASKKYNVDKGMDTDIAGRESTMTTMTDLMHQCMKPSPPKLPGRQARQQQQANMDIDTLAKQQSLTPLKSKHRPTPLNLEEPLYVGMISRHRQRYEVEHIPIKSSQAEFFNLPHHYPASSNYDDNDDERDGEPLTISPLHIPKCTERSVNFLEVYSHWRNNLNPVRTTSQGSINIRVPTKEEDTFLAKKSADEDRLPIVDYPVARPSPIVNHVRSRSSLGFRENRDRDDDDRQFPGDFESEAVENGVALASGLGLGVKRSATLNDIPHRNRQVSDGSASKTSGNSVAVAFNQEWGRPKSVSMSDVASRLEIPSSPYTPLTPFIMRAAGAPSCVEGGSKTLFGDHGWLEDTAASGPKKPKMEKKGGFMENLKQKARDLADSTSFKPARSSRTSAVNCIQISLNAREQSLLYGELEFNLNNAIDAYIKAQFNQGRLDANKLSRIANAWAQKGRPRVVGFRYDLETQIDLIAAQTETFRFYTDKQIKDPVVDPVVVAGMLHAMKMNARYMRIRTYCQPDSVIARQIMDSQKFVKLLGSPEHLERPLEEVAQFFKVALERHQVEVAAPAPRQGNVRVASKESRRFVSNGSSEQRNVHFQDEASERHHYDTKMPNASKSRTDVRDFGTSQIQLVKSQSEGQGLHNYRQLDDGTKASKSYGKAQGRSGHHQ